MTRRRTMLIVPARLVLAIALGAPAFPAGAARAEGPSCSASCKVAYGACYKKSQDRAKCQSQLQRCLESCIKSRR